MKLRDFLTRDNWCQGWYAFDSNGDPVSWDNPAASKFCLLGAIHYLYYGDKYWEVQDKYASLIRVLHRKRIKEFNDTATWPEIQTIIQSIDA